MAWQFGQAQDGLQLLGMVLEAQSRIADLERKRATTAAIGEGLSAQVAGLQLRLVDVADSPWRDAAERIARAEETIAVIAAEGNAAAAARCSLPVAREEQEQVHRWHNEQAFLLHDRVRLQPPGGHTQHNTTHAQRTQTTRTTHTKPMRAQTTRNTHTKPQERARALGVSTGSRLHARLLVGLSACTYLSRGMWPT